MKAFDAPSREECSARRPRSNTPLAALVTLNDPTFVEAARVLAALTMKQADLKNDTERAHWMLRRAIGRVPTSEDVAPLVKLLNSSRLYYAKSPKAAEELVAHGISPIDSDLDLTEHASWSQVARVILNLHETITRN